MLKSRMLISVCAIVAALAVSPVLAADDVMVITARHTEPIVAYLVQPEQLQPSTLALSQTKTTICNINDTLPSDVILAQPGGADVTVSTNWLFGAANQKFTSCNTVIAKGRLTYEVGWRA